MFRSLQFKLIRFGEQFFSSRFSWLLAPVAAVWGAVSTFRNWLYDNHKLPIVRVDIPVVSVGNLSVGGTGKTPLVILLAKQFPETKVAILARGYGARGEELNDEMNVIGRHLPGARLYQGSDRVKLAEQAVRDGADWILLDDGFQHRRLYRDLDLVLVSASDWTDSFLPRGRLRDGTTQLRRAAALFSYAPLPNAIQLKNRTTRVIDRFGQEISSIRGERVALFCGIGHPERFRATVEGLGAWVAAEKRLADHEPFLAVDLFYEECKLLNVKYLVCTEKDFVKLAPTQAPVIWIEIETQIAAGNEKWENLIAKIGQRLNNQYPR